MRKEANTSKIRDVASGVLLKHKTIIAINSEISEINRILYEVSKLTEASTIASITIEEYKMIIAGDKNIISAIAE